MFYAYIHSKPDGTPFYVGKGTGGRAYRMDRHSRNSHHVNIVAKYKKENILVGILDCSSESISFDLEKGLIKTLRRNNFALCNMSDGGKGGISGVSPSELTRKKLSAALIGKSKSAEHNKKVSLSNTGKKHTNEAKNKMSVSKTGVKLSLATKEKMSASAKGKKKSKEAIQKSADARKLIKFECPHCNKVGGIAMKRWHFNNCKSIPQVEL